LGESLALLFSPFIVQYSSYKTLLLVYGAYGIVALLSMLVIIWPFLKKFIHNICDEKYYPIGNY
jgi:hypothetical protein